MVVVVVFVRDDYGMKRIEAAANRFNNQNR